MDSRSLVKVSKAIIITIEHLIFAYCCYLTSQFRAVVLNFLSLYNTIEFTMKF
jgi:hypothetical protein